MMKINEIPKIKFGSSSDDIDDLANKVLKGEKTATSSLYDYYEMGLKDRSEIGDYLAVLNSKDEEVVLVRVEKIEIVKFGDVSENFAQEEGDGSLENWISIHRPYYSRLLSAIGKELSGDTLLVCEWFSVVTQ
ncbi:MAG: ASCH domain-containing protein [Bacteroidales bacterium]|nr:ASCH domain-containing protein [Bacteroidales bacterium]